MRSLHPGGALGGSAASPRVPGPSLQEGGSSRRPAATVRVWPGRTAGAAARSQHCRPPERNRWSSSRAHGRRPWRSCPPSRQLLQKPSRPREPPTGGSRAPIPPEALGCLLGGLELSPEEGVRQALTAEAESCGARPPGASWVQGTARARGLSWVASSAMPGLRQGRPGQPSVLKTCIFPIPPASSGAPFTLKCTESDTRGCPLSAQPGRRPESWHPRF